MSFFQMIGSWFEIIWEVILNILKSLIQFFVMLVSAVAMPPQLVMYMPAVLGSCVLAVVAIAVVKLIVGRE